MEFSIEQIKGVHPGLYLEQELKRQGIKKKDFAAIVDEYPQVINDITKMKRKMNIPLSIKIERVLDLPEGYLMTLQVYYDIKQYQDQNSPKPDLSKIRRILFWDTKMENIHWIRHKVAIIKRVFERGDHEEQAEIIRFYGQEEVEKILQNGNRTLSQYGF